VTNARPRRADFVAEFADERGDHRRGGFENGPYPLPLRSIPRSDGINAP
jgi:hypothetical protein